MPNPIESEYRRRLLERVHPGEQVEQVEQITYTNPDEEFSNVVSGLTLTSVDFVSAPYSSYCAEEELECTFCLPKTSTNNINNLSTIVLHNTNNGLELHKESTLVGDIVQLSIDVQQRHRFLVCDFSRPFNVFANQTIEIKVQLVSVTDSIRNLILGQPIYKICKI